MDSEYRRETERFIQRGRIAALVLAFALAISFGDARSTGITLAVVVLSVVVLAVQIGLRQSTSRRSVILIGWGSFIGDATLVLGLAVMRDPIDPVALVALMIAIEGAVRWGAAGAVGSGLLAGLLVVTWNYEAISRDLPAASIGLRVLTPVVLAVPVGQLIARLRRQRERTRRLFEHASDAMILTSNDRIVAANPAAAALVGVSPRTLQGELFAARVAELFGVTDLESRIGLPSGKWPHVCLTGDSGQPRWYAVRVEPAGDDGLLVVVASDVTEARLRQQRLEFTASHDPLTGLLNRTSMEALLNQWLGEQQPVGLIFLDLDRFKDVNDAYGHAGGDDVLVEVANRLNRLTRNADSVHRWAGDEFCVVVPGADQAVLDRLVQRVASVLQRPINVQGTTVRIDASIGAALAQTGDSAAALVHRADQRMYLRKGARSDVHRDADRHE